MSSHFGLESRVIPVPQLDPDLREAMYRLFAMYTTGSIAPASTTT